MLMLTLQRWIKIGRWFNFEVLKMNYSSTHFPVTRKVSASHTKVRLWIFKSPTSLAPKVHRGLLRASNSFVNSKVITGADSILDITNVATVWLITSLAWHPTVKWRQLWCSRDALFVWICEVWVGSLKLVLWQWVDFSFAWWLADYIASGDRQLISNNSKNWRRRWIYYVIRQFVSSIGSNTTLSILEFCVDPSFGWTFSYSHTYPSLD